jgi:hypothetical protein
MPAKKKAARKPAKNSSKPESPLPRGLDPEMIENLKASQKSLAKLGKERSLWQIYAMEVED